MRTLVVLLMLCCSCGGSQSYFNADQEIRGVSFDWGHQTDRDPTDVLLVADSHIHGDYEGAMVKFVDDPEVHCHVDFKVAGCWLPDLDLIILKPYPRIEDTALLHELTHRAQFFATGKLDMDHKEAPWWPLPEI